MRLAVHARGARAHAWALFWLVCRHVVRLLGLLRDATHVYLVLPLLEGGDLFNRIAEHQGAGGKAGGALRVWA